jgi:hypothetical protein
VIEAAAAWRARPPPRVAGPRGEAGDGVREHDRDDIFRRVDDGDLGRCVDGGRVVTDREVVEAPVPPPFSSADVDTGEPAVIPQDVGSAAGWLHRERGVVGPLVAPVLAAGAEVAGRHGRHGVESDATDQPRAGADLRLRHDTAGRRGRRLRHGLGEGAVRARDLVIRPGVIRPYEPQPETDREGCERRADQQPAPPRPSAERDVVLTHLDLDLLDERRLPTMARPSAGGYP